MLSSNSKSASGESRTAANFGILILSFSFFIGATSYAYKIFSQGGGGYQTGDWLINYGGGFVRRGFFGSLFLAVFGNTSFELWILFLVQVTLYGLVFGFFILHLLKNKSNWLRTILIGSPAGISFSGWDIFAFGRKEVLGYIVLVLLTLRIFQRENLTSSTTLLRIAILTYAAGVSVGNLLFFFVAINNLFGS